MPGQFHGLRLLALFPIQGSGGDIPTINRARQTRHGKQLTRSRLWKQANRLRLSLSDASSPGLCFRGPERCQL